MKKYLLLLLSLVFFSVTNGYGQVAYYTLAQSTGTLESIPATGVVSLKLNSATAATNNQNSTIANIGFSFVYGGKPFTQFGINENGVLTLGKVIASTLSTNQLSEATTNPKITALWDDFDFSTGGYCKSFLKGTAPYRKLVIEWNLNSANNNTSGPNTKYQVWLSETTNTIEFVYGASTGTLTSSSIGLTGLDAGEFASVTPGAPATVSSTTENNTNVVYPGNGVKYTFSPPAPLSGTKTVGTGKDFPNLSTAIKILNQAGVGGSGVNFTISGNHIEKVKSGVGLEPAGLLITASGTATSPIVFDWDGVGNKPILSAGVGVGNYDCILGLVGSDYVTINNLSLRDTSTNTNNAMRAEIGIGLFKKNKGTTVQGQNGCSHVTINNCMINLTKLPTAYVDVAQGYGGANYYYSTSFASKGIFASYFTPDFSYGTKLTGTAMHGNGNITGILSQADVHEYCTITNNMITNTTSGIVFHDGYKKLTTTNYIAGKQNIIGTLGSGNTIDNWGVTGTTAYFGASAARSNGWMRGFAAINMAGQADYSIEGNTISNCTVGTSATTAAYTFLGIMAGNGTNGLSWPQSSSQFSAKIKNNTISGIDASGLSLIGSGVYGISFSQNLDWASASFASNGSVEISSNTISNLRTLNGEVHGISSLPIGINSATHYYNNAATNILTGGFQTNGTVNISNNTIHSLSEKLQSGQTNINSGSVAGIFWHNAQDSLLVNNNLIGGSLSNAISRGLSTNAFYIPSQIGLKGIYLNPLKSNSVIRKYVSVNNNSISHLYTLALNTVAATEKSASVSAINIYNGATINDILSNTIENITVHNGIDNTTLSAFGIIQADGIPKSGPSTLNIASNTITNCSREGLFNTTPPTSGTGKDGFTAGIVAMYASGKQVKNILNNTISDITQTATTTTTDGGLYYAQMFGILTNGGNSIGNVTNIQGNQIKNLTGDIFGYSASSILSNTSSYAVAKQRNFHNLVGINTQNYYTCNISKNNICNLSTNAVGATSINATNNTSSGSLGVVGILVGKVSTSGLRSTTSEVISNNIISNITAPKIISYLALQGIHYYGYGRKANIVHNTISIGNPDGSVGGAVTNSTPNMTFGVTGVMLDYYYRNSATYALNYANNIVSINAICKGATSTTYGTTSTGGFGTCWRSFSFTSAKKKPKGISPSSNGNIYYINTNPRNLLYAQGTIFKNVAPTTSAAYLQNGFAFSQVIPNATRNILNTDSLPNNFNTNCGKYKSFWGTSEKLSFIDLDGTNIRPIPFQNSGACELALSPINEASFITNLGGQRPFAGISDDYAGVSRSGATVCAGALQTTTNFSENKVNLFLNANICNSVCPASNSLTIDIVPPTGYAIATGDRAPRLYFRRIKNNSSVAAASTDDNVIPTSIANNSATGPEGWRWVNPTSNTGNNFSFDVDLSLLKNTIVTAADNTIEYFIVAETTDGSIVDWSSGDFSATTCPSSVKLENISPIPTPLDTDAADVLENSVADNFSSFKGASLFKSIEYINNNSKYTTTNGTGFYVCLGEPLSLTAKYLAPDSTEFDAGCLEYKLQVSSVSTFATILDSVIQNTDTFQYVINTPGAKYFRTVLSCQGTTVVGSNTTYIQVTPNSAPVNNTISPVLNPVCIGNTNTLALAANPSSSYYFITSPIGRTFATSLTNPVGTSITYAPISKEEKGTWKTWALDKNAEIHLNAGFQSIDVSADESGKFTGNSNSTAFGKGIAFEVYKAVKLTSFNLVDALDGNNTTNLNISIYNQSDTTPVYTHSSAISVDDGSKSLISPSNWWLMPGTYYLVATPKLATDTEFSGGLASENAEFPLNVPSTTGAVVAITGGISEGDFKNITSDYNYFFDLNFSSYCTSNVVTFDMVVNDEICCATIPPTVDTIKANTLESGLTPYQCTANTEWIYYYVPTSSTDNSLRMVCAVHPNGNDWNPSDIVINNMGSIGDAAHLFSNGTDSAALMPYTVQIIHDEALTVNGGVKVKMYYPHSQKAAIDAYPTTQWFKYEGSKEDILTALTESGVTDKIDLTPSLAGTENNRPFVQFDNITTFSTFGFVGSTVPPVPLSVELLSFDVQKQEKHARLSWKTATEINSDYFIIEHSMDTKKWQEIGTIRAAGNSNSPKAYSYTDYTPASGTNYYRLRIIDLDKTERYSAIRLAEFVDNNVFVIYPNPIAAELSLTIEGIGIEKVQIYDFTQRLRFSQEFNSENKLDKLELPLNNLSSGVYLVVINGQHIQKLIVKG